MMDITMVFPDNYIHEGSNFLKATATIVTKLQLSWIENYGKSLNQRPPVRTPHLQTKSVPSSRPLIWVPQLERKLTRI